MAPSESHDMQSADALSSTVVARPTAPVGNAASHADATGHVGHVVQFYEDEDFLATTVARFLATGMAQGQPLIAIATQPRRQALSSELDRLGFDPVRAIREGRLVLADARETLTTFMDGAVPDRGRFTTVVSRLIESSRAAGRKTSVRLYGEMVDLLWKDGNTTGAIRLEELWNGLASTHSFSLLCAYEMSNFHRESDTSAFRKICGQHEHVIPTERYTEVDAATRMVEISVLQQRARSLENEIEQRKELELQLRRALDERGRAEEAAKAANRAKSEFLAVMSHELRTPLNAIGGHIQLIEMGLHGPVTPAQRDALARAQSNQRHLLSLINDVLNLVRIETGRLEYVMEAMELRPLLSEVVAMIEPLLHDKRLTCEVALPCAPTAPPATVYADREKVQQILLNLLTNSIKFTPAEGRIELSVVAPDVPGMTRLMVRDTGIGIPSAKLAQVFDPFVQAGPRPRSQHDGVGLGLAISRDLARGMGGDLVAESEEGEGTTVTLTLPATPSER